MFNYPIGKGGMPPKKVSKAPVMEQEPDGDEMGEEDGAAVHEQHGPPMEVHTEHDDETGMHHVHSVHMDGHEHMSDHPTREAAHEHVGKLHGHGKQEHSESEGDEEH
jgi:hypothetical protein